MINSVLFGSGRRTTCLIQWCRAVTVSQHTLKAALHIVNIDFELN